MPLNKEFIAFVQDQLHGLGLVAIRRMFGGAGVYLNGQIFGLIADDTLYLKVDDNNRQAYQDAGMEPFRPFADKPYVMSYWQVPIDVLEDPDELKEWARQAVRAGGKKKEPKKWLAKK